ncbi:MAG: hypothetical protein HOP20_06150 [Sulfuriferula sp.]|nr:hypothetical protein [Sulfuriferula sp.]
MANITISAPLVDGSLMPYISENDSCEDTVLFVCGDDLRPRPRSVKITVKTESGKVMEISIPNDANSIAKVTIDGTKI